MTVKPGQLKHTIIKCKDGKKPWINIILIHLCLSEDQPRVCPESARGLPRVCPESAQSLTSVWWFHNYGIKVPHFWYIYESTNFFCLLQVLQVFLYTQHIYTQVGYMISTAVPVMERSLLYLRISDHRLQVVAKHRAKYSIFLFAGVADWRPFTVEILTLQWSYIAGSTVSNQI
jgi:hypothetical protein